MDVFVAKVMVVQYRQQVFQVTRALKRFISHCHYIELFGVSFPSLYCFTSLQRIHYNTIVLQVHINRPVGFTIIAVSSLKL